MKVNEGLLSRANSKRLLDAIDLFLEGKKVRVEKKDLFRIYKEEFNPPSINYSEGLKILIGKLEEKELISTSKVPFKSEKFFIKLIRKSRVETYKKVQWHPDLIDWASNHKGEIKLDLITLNNWLCQFQQFNEFVPLKERSFEIYQDEKRLDKYFTKGKLFGGQLNLESIGCKLIEVPIICKTYDQLKGLPILIVENLASWFSFCEWNKKSKQFSSIYYGKGMELYSSHSMIEELNGSQECFYIGDIDPTGIFIPYDISLWRAEKQLAPIKPFIKAYEWILKNGKPIRSKSKSEVVREEVICEWLPFDIAGKCIELFKKKMRIPQESLGLKQLNSGQID